MKINVRDQVRVQVKTRTHISVELKVKNQIKMVKVKVRNLLCEGQKISSRTRFQL